MDNPDPNSWLKIIIVLLSILFFFSFATGLSLILKGYLPKASEDDDESSRLPRAARWLSTAAAPWIILTSGLARLLLLLSGHTPQAQESVTEDEVKDLIEQGTEEGTFEKTEQAMVDNIFHMSDQTIYALMTPRPQMLWLDLADPLKHNLRLIRESRKHALHLLCVLGCRVFFVLVVLVIKTKQPAEQPSFFFTPGSVL